MPAVETIARADVVAAARKYLGFPLRHQGRLQALDCVGLALAVAEDLGLADAAGTPIRRADYQSYGPQPVNAFVLEECRRRLLAAAGPAFLGDVLVLRVPTVPCHVAIATSVQGQLGIIHAYPGGGRVIEHRVDGAWARRVAGRFRFPGVVR